MRSIQAGVCARRIVGLSAAAQEAVADFHQVTDAELAVAVLIEHRTQQSAGQSALLLGMPLFLAEHLAQRLRARLRYCLDIALAEHALGQVGHHDGCQHFQQGTGLFAANPRELADALLGARLLAAEDMGQDLPALAAATAQYGTQDAADIQSGVVLL